MKFKYFESPEKYAAFTDEETACDICKKVKKCFEASVFSGSDTIDAICPECLAAGRLQKMEIYTCQGDRSELEKQLQLLNPSLTTEAINKIANDRTEELEKYTPPLITWQDWDWPCADGDYCTFLAFGSRTLYNQLAKDKNGEALFKNSIYYSQEADSDTSELWDNCIPDKLILSNEETGGMSILVYVFKSLHSDKIVTLWDIE